MKPGKLLETLIRIIDTLTSLLPRCQPLPAVTFNVRFGLPTLKSTKETHMLEVTITTEQKIRATVKPTTTGGRPAKIDGRPTWEVTVGTASIENQSEDGLSADLVSGDDPGFSEVVIKADADVGEGTQEISAFISLTVEGAKAANLGVSVGQPEDKAPAPEARKR